MPALLVSLLAAFAERARRGVRGRAGRRVRRTAVRGIVRRCQALDLGHHPGLAVVDLPGQEVIALHGLFEGEQVFLAPRPLKARGDGIGVGLDAPVAEGRQALRITLAVDDRAQDALAGQSRDVGDHRVEPDVHLGQRLLHVQDTAGAVLGQPPHLACVGAQRANLVAWTERAAQQAVGHQLPDPLAVQHVALAPADLLRHARRHQQHLEARTLQRLVDRDPVDRGRLHRDLRHPARRQPCRHFLLIAGKAAERTHRLLAAFRVDRHEVPPLADVDPCAVRVHHPEAPGSSRLARHGTSSRRSSPPRAGRNHVRSPTLLNEVAGNPRHQ